MTGVVGTTGAGTGLQSVTGAGTGLRSVTGARAGLEAAPALLTLVTPGGAPVCEGDSCFVPGAEGIWSEVPD